MYLRENALIAIRLFFSPLGGVYWALTGKDYLIAPERKERRLREIFEGPCTKAGGQRAAEALRADRIMDKYRQAKAGQ